MGSQFLAQASDPQSLKGLKPALPASEASNRSGSPASSLYRCCCTKPGEIPRTCGYIAYIRRIYLSIYIYIQYISILSKVYIYMFIYIYIGITGYRLEIWLLVKVSFHDSHCFLVRSFVQSSLSKSRLAVTAISRDSIYFVYTYTYYAL